MDYLRRHDYPVPAVEEVSADETELVMERLDGDSMVAALSRRPWSLRRQAAVLASLHRRLHDIPAPEWVPKALGGEGDSLLHLDLHPLNVMITDKGPFVIDWTNASRGVAAVDVALAWVLLASGEVPYGRVRATVLGLGRAFFIKAFLRNCDLAAARAQLREVVTWKVADPNMSEVERQAMWALANREGVR
jgi:aminoglycoside phosphotransferase (APT) family kinase protein